MNKIRIKNTKPIVNAIGATCGRPKDHRGITLVALIITIIVMLILVGVSITIAINGGLFDTTKRAAKQTEKAKNAEQELSSGRVKIDGIWYDSLEDYAIGKQSAVQGVEDLTESNTSFIYNPTTWTNGEVKVTISTTALTSGFRLQYSTDGLNWSDYTAGTEIPVGRDGEIYAKMVDSEGNEGGSVSGKAAKIDKEGPTINTHLNSTGAVGNTIPLSINVTDSNSGISKIEWYYKQSTASDYTTITDEYIAMNGATAGDKTAVTKETTLTGLTGLATYNIYAVVYDVAGNSTRSPSGTGTIDIQAQQPLVIPEVGDYVNYEPDTVSTPYSLLGNASGYGTYTSSLPQTLQTPTEQNISQETLTWQVLKVHDNGTIDIIGNPTTQIVYFGGTLGYNNGVYLMHDICETLYSRKSNGITARSASLEDFEDDSNGGAWKTARNSSTVGAGYGNTKEYTDVSNSYYPSLYAQENGSGIDTTTVKTNGIKNANRYYSSPTTEEWSQASSRLTATHTYYNILINEINYGKSASILSTTEYYWVASRCCNVTAGSVSFLLSIVSADLNAVYLCTSKGETRGIIPAFGLRPVVSLKSTVQYNKVSEINGVKTFDITKY